MKMIQPTKRLVDTLENRHRRMDKVIPANPKKLSDLQKYHLFQENPGVVSQLPVDQRTPFVVEMQRLAAKYGGSHG